MATYRKRGKRWQAIVRKGEINTSATFNSKAAAMAWAASIEVSGTDPTRHTFGDLMARYRDTVSVTKRGAKWEQLRINLILRDPLAKVRLSDLGKRDLAEWRDRRLEKVSPTSVLREIALLSHAIKVAINDWEWLENNPLSAISKPKAAPPRTRRPTQDELDRLLYVLGDDYNRISGRVGLAMLFSIETAMRAGEICNLRRQDIKGKVATVQTAKTQAGVREVPLGEEALRILSLLPADANQPGAQIFGLKTAQVDSLFRKAKAQALVEGLHFHDLRAEAITRLSKKVDLLALAKMVGHKDLSMLQVYYRETAEQIAARL